MRKDFQSAEQRAKAATAAFDTARSLLGRWAALASMFCFVKFQSGSCRNTKATSRFYSQVNMIESRVFGRLVNVRD